MNLLILEITKYLICLLMLVYVAESFLVFRFPEGAHLRGVCIRQNIWMFAIQALIFAQIITQTGELRYLEYYLGQAGLLLAVPVVFCRLFPAASLTAPGFTAASFQPEPRMLSPRSFWQIPLPLSYPTHRAFLCEFP